MSSAEKLHFHPVLSDRGDDQKNSSHTAEHLPHDL